MNKSNPSRKYIISTLAIMVFIFIQSSLGGEESGAQSGFIMEFLSRIFGGTPSEDFHFWIRKIAHFTEYALLGTSLALLIWSPSGDTAKSVDTSGDSKSQRPAADSNNLNAPLPTPRYALIAWAIGAVYAVTDEIHQALVPERSCEVRDMIIDAAGVLFGVLITAIILYYSRKKKLGR